MAELRRRAKSSGPLLSPPVLKPPTLSAVSVGSRPTCGGPPGLRSALRRGADAQPNDPALAARPSRLQPARRSEDRAAFRASRHSPLPRPCASELRGTRRPAVGAGARGQAVESARGRQQFGLAGHREGTGPSERVWLGRRSRSQPRCVRPGRRAARHEDMAKVAPLQGHAEERLARRGVSLPAPGGRPGLQSQLQSRSVLASSEGHTDAIKYLVLLVRPVGPTASSLRGESRGPLPRERGGHRARPGPHP